MIRNRPRRCGLATLEAVLATAITVPVATFFVLAAVAICKSFYHEVASLVCWPFL